MSCIYLKHEPYNFFKNVLTLFLTIPTRTDKEQFLKIKVSFWIEFTRIIIYYNN